MFDNWLHALSRQKKHWSDKHALSLYGQEVFVTSRFFTAAIIVDQPISRSDKYAPVTSSRNTNPNVLSTTAMSDIAIIVLAKIINNI